MRTPRARSPSCGRRRRKMRPRARTEWGESGASIIRREPRSAAPFPSRGHGRDRRRPVCRHSRSGVAEHGHRGVAGCGESPRRSTAGAAPWGGGLVGGLQTAESRVEWANELEGRRGMLATRWRRAMGPFGTGWHDLPSTTCAAVGHRSRARRTRRRGRKRDRCPLCPMRGLLGAFLTRATPGSGPNGGASASQGAQSAVELAESWPERVEVPPDLACFAFPDAEDESPRSLYFGYAPACPGSRDRGGSRLHHGPAPARRGACSS